MSKTFEDISLNFEQVIHQMQDDLRYLVDKGKVSKGFIGKQNRTLKTLIEYYHTSKAQIEHYHLELINTQRAYGTEREKLTDRIVQFEAICIIHGIIDFPHFLALPKWVLIDMAENLHKDGSFMCSDMMKSFIKDLPPEKGEQLEHILFERVQTRLKKLIQKITPKNNIKDGNRTC